LATHNVLGDIWLIGLGQALALTLYRPIPLRTEGVSPP
jgi:hypothetical protein